jgi:hypothetical protein
MFLRFHFLREPAGMIQALRTDGWDLAGEGDWVVRASHPDAPEEGAARERLDGLGLLTSGALRIHFDHSRRPALG